MDNVVLGAGISGMATYWANPECHIYEAKNEAGGLCGGFEIDGFRFDNAVHLSFTDNQLVRSIFDQVPYYIHSPESSSWYRGMWLRHPAQNNLYPLPVETKIKAIKGFVNREDLTDVTNFEQWTRSGYGDWLYENLFRPYNEKYWCTKLEDLGIDWIGKRIYRPSLDEVLYGSYTNDTPNTYYAKEMRYPKIGGYRAFIQPIIDDAINRERLHLNKDVCRISIRDKVIYFTDGTNIKYDGLYSSIPLPQMINLIDEAPIELKGQARSLECTGVVLVSIGFKRFIEFDKMWFYFYDTDIMAARAYMPSIKSKANTPEGHSSVQFEIYYNTKDDVPNREDCIANCIYAMEKIGMAKESDISCVDYRVLSYGNVIFKKGTEETARHLIQWEKKVGITPIGRFGEWKYYWSDQAFMSGYNAAKERER